MIRALPRDARITFGHHIGEEASQLTERTELRQNRRSPCRHQVFSGILTGFPAVVDGNFVLKEVLRWWLVPSLHGYWPAPVSSDREPPSLRYGRPAVSGSAAPCLGHVFFFQNFLNSADGFVPEMRSGRRWLVCPLRRRWPALVLSGARAIFCFFGPYLPDSAIAGYPQSSLNGFPGFPRAG
jgi:hypothetical protein